MFARGLLALRLACLRGKHPWKMSGEPIPATFCLFVSAKGWGGHFAVHRAVCALPPLGLCWEDKDERELKGELSHGGFPDLGVQLERTSQVCLSTVIHVLLDLF